MFKFQENLKEMLCPRKYIIKHTFLNYTVMLEVKYSLFNKCNNLYEPTLYLIIKFT